MQFVSDNRLNLWLDLWKFCCIFHRFGLNTYDSTKAVVNAMNFRYIGGTTNTSQAIKLMRTQ